MSGYLEKGDFNCHGARPVHLIITMKPGGVQYGNGRVGRDSANGWWYTRDSANNVEKVPCRANMAHIRQLGPDYGLSVQVNILRTFNVVPSSLGSGWAGLGDWVVVQGYFAHQKQFSPLGPPQDPRCSPTVGS